MRYAATYRDAIDDIYRRYADKIDTGNVSIMGVSYGGAVTYGMAVRFPYLFDAVIPVFGTSFYVVSWFGNAVQWCGVEWAEKVLLFCKERPDPLLQGRPPRADLGPL